MTVQYDRPACEMSGWWIRRRLRGSGSAADSGIRTDSSCRKVDGPVCLRPSRVSVCFEDKYGGPDVRPAVSEEYSPVDLAVGGGEVAPPLVVVESDTARVSDLQMVESDTTRFSWMWSFSGCWPAVSPIGFGGNFADFDGRASPVGSCSPGRNHGG